MHHSNIILGISLKECIIVSWVMEFLKLFHFCKPYISTYKTHVTVYNFARFLLYFRICKCPRGVSRRSTKSTYSSHPRQCITFVDTFGVDCGTANPTQVALNSNARHYPSTMKMLSYLLYQQNGTILVPSNQD